MNPLILGKLNSRRKAYNRIQDARRHTRQLAHRRVRRRQNIGTVNYKRSLRFGLLNTDGLVHETLEDVKSTIELKHPDLVILLETKRRLEDSGIDIGIEGYAHYEIKRSDVAGDRPGGGISFYTKLSDGLVFHRHSPEITDENLSFVNNERFWVTLNSSSYKTAVCGLYVGCQYPDDRYGQYNDDLYGVVQREAGQL